MLAVERAQDPDRRAAMRYQQGAAHPAGQQIAGGVQRPVEPEPVQLLQLAQPVLPLAPRRGQLRIAAEHFLPPLVQPQVGQLAAEVLLQLVDLALALLPPRGHHRDAAAHVERVERGEHGGGKALRTQKHDPGHDRRLPAARRSVLA